MSTARESMTKAVADLATWDGEDPATLEALVDATATAVRAFARDVEPAETRGPEGLALLAEANATLARALSRTIAGGARAEARGDDDASQRINTTGRRLRDLTAQLARETAARVSK